MLIKKQLNNVVGYVFFGLVMSLGLTSQAIAGWQLEWIDDFDGNRVNKDNWTSQVQANYNNEVQCYTDDDTSAIKNYDVSDGTLKIISRRQNNNCAGLNGTFKSWTSGRLNSKDKREFLYGRIESRIKFNSVKAGSWPAFWMLENRINEHPIANDNDFVGWPNPGAGEIDVWEWYANSPHTYITNFFNTGGAQCGREVRYNYPNGSADVLDWHTYAMEWSSDTIEFFVDDTLVSSQDVSNCAQYKEPMFVLLNVAMGGNLGGTIDSTLNSATMEVDYVAHCTETTANSETRCKINTVNTTGTPVISSIAPTTVISGETYNYTLTASGDGNITMAATVLPDWLTFDSVSGRLSGTPSISDAGSNTVTLTASDGTGTTSQTFSLNVFATGGSTNSSDNGGGGSMGFLLMMLLGGFLLTRSAAFKQPN